MISLREQNYTSCVESLDMNLLQFQDLTPSNDLYLDSRYWSKIFSGYKDFSTQSFTVDISDENPSYFLSTSHTSRYSVDSACPSIILVKVTILTAGTKLMTHNVVFIYEREKQLLVRYNPSKTGDHIRLLDRLMANIFPKEVKLETYYNNSITTHCVASCIYFVLAYLSGENLYIDEEETRKFVTKIKRTYGKITGKPLVEMGDMFSGGQALIGGLGGGLLGGLIAGPTGLVVGGVGGALIGGML